MIPGEIIKQEISLAVLDPLGKEGRRWQNFFQGLGNQFGWLCHQAVRRIHLRVQDALICRIESI